MSSPCTLTFICEQLVKDLKNQVLFPPKSDWQLQAMCQKREYGCRLVVQLFNTSGKNLKSQMIMRVENISELGEVHEFLNGCRNYLTRHAMIVGRSSKFDYSTETVAGDQSGDEDTLNEDLAKFAGGSNKYFSD